MLKSNLSIRNAATLVLWLFLFIAISVVGHASDLVPCGKEWINLHKKNPDLMGVYVQQSPDNGDYDEAAYKGKHPSMIIYVFKNEKAHQVSYSPTGQIQNAFWWNIPKNDWIYSRLSTDFKESVSCSYRVK